MYIIEANDRQEFFSYVHISLGHNFIQPTTIILDKK